MSGDYFQLVNIQIENRNVGGYYIMAIENGTFWSLLVLRSIEKTIVKSLLVYLRQVIIYWVIQEDHWIIEENDELLFYKYIRQLLWRTDKIYL